MGTGIHYVYKLIDDVKAKDILVKIELQGLKVAGLLGKVQNEIARSVNVSQFTLTEDAQRKRMKDHFLTGILNVPKIILMGTENVFDDV